MSIFGNLRYTSLLAVLVVYESELAVDLFRGLRASGRSTLLKTALVRVVIRSRALVVLVLALSGMIFVAFPLLQFFIIVKLIGDEEEIAVIKGGVVAGAVSVRLALCLGRR